MLEWEDVKNASLGEPFDVRDLRRCCKEVFGGVSWPGKRPGFAVVLAMDRTRHLDSYDVCLLDEYESFSTRELVRQCSALDSKYRPDRWIGDCKNGAASRFIQDMHDENLEGNRSRKRQFSLEWTTLASWDNRL